MAQRKITMGHIFSVSRARIYRAAIALLISFPIFAADNTFQAIAKDLKKADLKTKYEALEKFKTFRSAEAAQVLAQSANREKDTNFRLTVLDQIAALGQPSVVPLLAPLFRDKNISVRQRSARVVGMLGGPAAEDVLLNAMSGESDASVKAAIAQGLSLCGSDKSIEALNAASTDNSPEVRANAKHAMERMRKPVVAKSEMRNERRKQTK